jgi:hypothetical protein
MADHSMVGGHIGFKPSVVGPTWTCTMHPSRLIYVPECLEVRCGDELVQEWATRGLERIAGKMVQLTGFTEK